MAAPLSGSCVAATGTQTLSQGPSASGDGCLRLGSMAVAPRKKGLVPGPGATQPCQSTCNKNSSARAHWVPHVGRDHRGAETGVGPDVLAASRVLTAPLRRVHEAPPMSLYTGALGLGELVSLLATDGGTGLSCGHEGGYPVCQGQEVPQSVVPWPLWGGAGAPLRPCRRPVPRARRGPGLGGMAGVGGAPPLGRPAAWWSRPSAP